MKKFQLFLLLLPLFFCLPAQQLNDGPIQLQARVREWDVTLLQPNDASLNVSFFNLGAISEDEYTFKIWGRGSAVNTTWFGGTCLLDEFDPTIQNSTDFNHNFYNQTFPTAAVPQFMDLRVDCHEDDMYDFAYYLSWTGGLVPCANLTTYPRCNFDPTTCCLQIPFFPCVLQEADDIRCDAQPFKSSLDYRLGPPCQWYNHGFVIGGGCTDNVYRPRVETFWRYTDGTSCATAIDLGTLNAVPLTHYNSNECYSNNFASSPGNDVYYKFTITQPRGVRMSVCGSASFDTYMYVLDANCVPIASNDNFCNSTSEVTRGLCDPGTYYVVIDGATAADMGTFTLTVSDIPGTLLQTNAGPDRVVCLGQSATLGGIPAASFGAGGYQYSWTPATGLSATNVANPTITGLAPGTTNYILAVTDLSGCTIRDTAVVTVSTPPTAGINTSTTLICSGAVANLSASGGTGSPAYQWLLNNGTLAGANAATYQANLPGNYAVIAYNALGCADTSSTITLSVIPSAVANVASVSNTAICSGDTVFLNAFGIGLNYQWLNNGNPIAGATTANYAATGAGSFSVIMSFAGQCADTSNAVSVVVSPNPNPSIVPATSQTICSGQSVQFTAGGGGTYQWYYNGLPQPNTSATFTATQAGTYYAQVTVGPCSLNTSPVVLNVNTSPVALATASGNPNLCQGQSVTLIGNASTSGTQSVQWVQLPSASVSTASNYTASSSGSYAFIINDNGCIDTSNVINVIVNTPAPIALTPNSPQNICAGNSVQLQVTGAAAGSLVTWYLNGQPISNSNILTASNAGTYYATAQDLNGCISQSTTVPLTVTPVLPANITANGNTAFCEGGSVVLVGSGNGTIGQVYSWLYNGSLISNASSIMADQAGDYTFVLNNQGCISSSTPVSVSVFPTPSATISPAGPLAICEGSTTNLIVSGGASYQWLNNGQSLPNATNPLLVVSESGNYSANILDANGCAGTSNVVNVSYLPLPNPVIEAKGNTVFCEGESVDLEASGGLNYQWLEAQNPVPAATNPVLNVSETGTFSAIVSNVCGSDTTLTINTLKTPLPTPFFLTEPTELFAGLMFRFVDQSVNAASWSWNFGDNGNGSLLQNPTHTYYNAGNYLVNLTVSNQLGCEANISLSLNVQESNVFIPNTFTPNGDGTHDEFETYFNALKSMQFTIFDRWGKQVFVTNDPLQRWDGTLNGKEAAVGTYYYVLDGTDHLGKSIVRKGFVELVR